MIRHAVSLLLLLTMFCRTSSGQNRDKPPIDKNTFNTWPSVKGGKLSADGKYAGYICSKNIRFGQTFCVASIDGKWQQCVKNITGGDFEFTADSRKVIYSLPGDTIAIMSLGSGSRQYLAGVGWYKHFRNPEGEWLVYRLKEQKDNLVARRLDGKDSWRVTARGEVYLFGDNNLLVLQSPIAEGSNTQRLSWVDFKTGRERFIRQGARVEQLLIDKSERFLAFLASDTINQLPCNSIWQYEFATNVQTRLLSDASVLFEEGTKITTLLGYNEAGDRLFVNLQRQASAEKMRINPIVDIWSYQDRTYGTEAPAIISNTFLVVVDTKDRQLIRLQYGEEEVRSEVSGNHNPVEEWVLVVDNHGNSFDDMRLDSGLKSDIFLVSARTGRRVEVKMGESARTAQDYSLSPGQRFVFYYSPGTRSLFSYEISTGRLRETSGKIPLSKTDTNEVPVKYALHVEGWLQDDQAVLLSDGLDIWLVDPLSVKVPVNLTQGWGKEHSLEFHIIGAADRTFIKHGEIIYLSGFNKISKDRGVYQLTLSGRPKFKKLYSGQYCYGYNGPGGEINGAFVKASHANTYLLLRESASDFPNYYVTSDFKHLQAISDIHPEKAYNWLTSELVSWTGEDGMLRQAILYKPENFDSTRRYPVIFYYYEDLSHELNLFRYPEASRGQMNIPWFVSNGYLVFCPDMYYSAGEPGESALESVLSAARQAARWSFADTTRMGLQGHSFGGYETNFIITRTNKFAAACSASGLSDFVSMYNSVNTNLGISRNSYFELSQGRMGARFWDRPELYVKNSPLYNCAGVTTPLLMMNNKKDLSVPYTQGTEFFTALKRQKKKVWMLQYHDGAHSVSGKSAEDFHERLVGFFDHYLKGKPAPLWMNADSAGR